MPSSGPTHEVRLGVVLYGGASLAVYMSGVARELFNVVHASRLPPTVVATPDPHTSATATLGTTPPAPPRSTRDTSASPSATLSPAAPTPDSPTANPPTAAPDSPAAALASQLERVYGRVIAAMDEDLGAGPGSSRVSVDVIVGASAGGINGVFLAKALAADASPMAFDALRTMWLEDASIAALVRRRQPGAIRALFDGDFVFARLRQALAELERAPRAAGDAPPAE
jgi:hypothetical protein